jgi:tagatose 6-phosphate kinase
MILTVTLNPCLDKSLFVAANVAEETLRATAVRDLAGGKGVNVARALRGLGAPVGALMPLGGHSGAHVAALAQAESLNPIAVPIAGTTRYALTVLEEPTGKTWHYLEPGPTLSEAEIEGLRTTFCRAVTTARLVIVSGSVACAELVPLIAWMVETARAAGRETIVDTHGPALAAALEARPWMVKPNREELAAVLGISLETEESQWEALVALEARGIAVTVLSLGAEGLRCRWNGVQYEAVPPRVTEVNALGGGDSLVAGIAVAWLRGDRPLECLRFGTACGAANAATWDPGGIDAAAVAELLPRVAVRETEREGESGG